MPEWPLAIDLLLLLPLAYAVLHRRTPRRAVAGAAVLAGLGIVAGSWILPESSKHGWLLLEQLRWAGIGLLVLVELALIVLVLAAVVRASRSHNLELALDQAVQRRFGSGTATRLLRLEARMWLYALLPRPVRRPFPGEQHFSVHAQGQNASNQAAFLVIVGAEIPLLHLLLHFLWSPLAACIVSALSLYGWLFLLAEYRATRLRPVSIDGDQLRLRYGVVGDLALPLAAISAAGPWHGPLPRAPRRLRLVGMGTANVRLQLHPGTRLDGLLRRQPVDEVMLGIDQPAAFLAALDSARTRRAAD